LNIFVGSIWLGLEVFACLKALYWIILIRKVIVLRFDHTVNQRIGEVRQALGHTQEQFAEGIKISKTYQGHIERNERRANDRIIKIISMTYGVNEEWLKTGTGDMFDKFDDFRLEQLTYNFKKLDAKAQEYALKLIDLLVNYEADKSS
jgi:transcriptional regulator with XRE-family HTH domain